MEDVVDLLDRHEVQSHLYADYIQLYTSCRPGDVDILRTRLSHCSADVAQWCACRGLQLNASKTGKSWFGSHANIMKLRDHELTVRVVPEIVPERVVRDLTVQLDKELSMKTHVTKVSSACSITCVGCARYAVASEQKSQHSWCLPLTRRG